MTTRLKSPVAMKALAIAAASAITITGITLADTDPAQAAGGKADTTTGVVWGENAGSAGIGSYEFTLPNKSVARGFVLDKDKKHPVASDSYGQARTWMGLDAEQRGKLAVSMWIGQQFDKGQEITPIVSDVSRIAATDEGKAAFGNTPPFLSTNRDAMSAALAATVLSVSTPGYTPAGLSQDARKTYDTLAILGKLTEENKSNAFLIRSSKDTSYSDVISVQDAMLAPPVVAGVSLSEGVDPKPTSVPTQTQTPTTSSTTTTTDPTQTTEPTTTTEPEKIQLRTSAGTKSQNIYYAREITPDGDAAIVDTVTFTGVEPGREYKLVGEIHYKDDKGEAVKTDFRGETTFTPEAYSGRIDVSIPMNNVVSSEIVVYETLLTTSDNREVASHHDINDRSQTVGIKDVDLTSTPAPSPSTTSTGTTAEPSSSSPSTTQSGSPTVSTSTSESPSTSSSSPTSSTSTSPSTTRREIDSVTFGNSDTSGSMFKDCVEASRAGYKDMHVGDTGYSATLDKDGDGIACESTTTDDTSEGAGANNNAPRQTISDVPSGASSRVGSSVFNR